MGNKNHQKINPDALFYELKEKDQLENKDLNDPKYACDCKGAYCDGFPVSIHPILYEKIEDLRKIIPGSITIVSGIRCFKQNKQIDGSPLSFHQLGRAVDISCERLDIFTLGRLAESLGLAVIYDREEDVLHCQWNE